MATRSGFFNSVNGDRRYDAKLFAEYFATFISNGVFPNPSTGLQVYEKSNMTITIKPGKGWINGFYFVNDSDYDVTIANADGVLNRIDRVVLRWDNANRTINFSVKQGTFATNPVAPTLQRDADAYELALADIYIGKGAISITQSNISDQRLNTSLCGIVHGVVNQVDTTTLFNQYQSWFNQITSGTEDEIEVWQAQQEQEFNVWFEGIKGILDGDVAGNLANQIATVSQNLDIHSKNSEIHVNEYYRSKWNDYRSTYKSKKDSSSIFMVVEHKRENGTLAERSTFSNKVGNVYKTRTYEEFYLDGETVIKKIVYSLTHDGDDELISEVIQQ